MRRREFITLLSGAAAAWPLAVHAGDAGDRFLGRRVSSDHCRTISSMSRSGVPTAMKPPIIRLAPSGIMATDRSS
jgi:hypothetical protein